VFEFDTRIGGCEVPIGVGVSGITIAISPKPPNVPG
jgi:hypothetical protein